MKRLNCRKKEAKRSAEEMIGEIIKELRKERDLTQSELAQAIGVSQKAIDYWERNINEPKASYIVKLADYFDVSADVLLGRNY